MQRYLIRLVLIASAFYFVFPMIHGIQFHGNFLHALLAGMVFAFLGWVVESFAIAITAMLAIGTLGLALLILIPVWVLGFWLLPAVVLKFLADLMPGTISFAGWTPAIWGGLVMLCIGVATSAGMTRQSKGTSTTTTTVVTTANP